MACKDAAGLGAVALANLAPSLSHDRSPDGIVRNFFWIERSQALIVNAAQCLTS